MPKEIHPYAVLLRPIITEKTTVLTGADKYVFEVDLRANKIQIKEAVEVAFNVRVAEVNTMVMKGKPQALRPPCHEPPRLEEGHRHPRLGRQNRTVRGGLGNAD